MARHGRVSAVRSGRPEDAGGRTAAAAGPSCVAISSFSRNVAGDWRRGNSATKAMPASWTRRLDLPRPSPRPGRSPRRSRRPCPTRTPPAPAARPYHSRRQQQDGVEVLSGHQGAETVDGRGAELGGGQLGPAAHLVADRADLEPIAQARRAGRCLVLPGGSQSDQTDAESHAELASIARTEKLGPRRSALVTRARTGWPSV